MSAINEYTQAIIAAIHTGYVPLEKTAEHLMYRLNPGGVDDGALGRQFTKLALDSGLDPWALAWDVASNFDRIVLNKDLELQKTAEFYIGWMKDMEKRALSFGGIKAGIKRLGAGLKGLFKGTKAVAPKVSKGAQKAVVKGGPGGAAMAEMLPKSAPRISKPTRALATKPVSGSAVAKVPAKAPESWAIGVKPGAEEATRVTAAKEMAKKAPGYAPAKGGTRVDRPVSGPKPRPEGTQAAEMAPAPKPRRVEPTGEIPSRAPTARTSDQDLFAAGAKAPGEQTKMFQQAQLVNPEAPTYVEPALSRAPARYLGGGVEAAETAAAAGKPISSMWAMPAIASGVGVPTYMMTQGSTPPPGYGQY